MKAWCLFLVVLGTLVPVLARPSLAAAEDGRIPPPRPETDAGPPPLPQPRQLARRPVEVVPELAVSLPLCQSDPGAARCEALGAAFGGALAALYRPNPYFAFGAGVSYLRASGSLDTGSLEGEVLGVEAQGRVYLYEEGSFDPYLELDLGYASLRTTRTAPDGSRLEDAAFGPSVRVGGGLDFVVTSSLELGGSLGFSHLLLERGERCAARGCTAGGAPGGAMVGGLMLGLRATLLLGEPL